MIGIITLLLVVAIGLLITRIATVALTFTGLSKDLARFQARSAFTTCGFTTAESERLVEHPVRRRIIMLLMLLGNGAVVMAISSLIPVFLAVSDHDSPSMALFVRMVLLAAGLLLIWIFAGSQWIDDRLSRIIEWSLRTFTSLDVRDFHSLLHLSEGFSVNEFVVGPEDWVIGKALHQLRLPDEGIQVLGIRRVNGTYIGTPTGRTFLQEGDILLLYGRYTDLEELERRRADSSGDQVHEQRVREVQLALHQQDENERMRYERDGRDASFLSSLSLLDFPEGFSVTEMIVQKGNWTIGKHLAELRLADEGLQILGVRRANGDFVSTPTGETLILEHDTLLIYGQKESVASLASRSAGSQGDHEHNERAAKCREGASLVALLHEGQEST